MKNIRFTIYSIFCVGSLLLLPAILNAQQSAENLSPSSPKTAFPVDMDTALFIVALTLAFVILILVRVLQSAIRFHFKNKSSSKSNKIIAIGIIVLFSVDMVSAQTVKSNSQFLLSTQGWILFVIIALELYAISQLTKWLKYYTGIEAYEAGIAKNKSDLWKKINAAAPIELEDTVDTGHNYDGIRELDNITPPWFTAAFIGTIIFAAIYMYRYHIADSAITQIDEYNIAMKKAEIQQLEYLKNEANLIDENTVTMMNEGQFEEGKNIYKTACAVCHGDAGQGLVGPNMTDDYWIHGGSIKDIFKVIKYGVLDKGMKSWKDDYSPNQIAQLSSYIKSMRGTNPPNPKEPQGELYKDINSVSQNQTSKQGTDTLKTKTK